MKKILEFLKCYWPSMIVLAVIFYATLASDPAGADELPPIPHIDKLIHAIMMGGLVGAVAFDYKRAERQTRMLTSRFMLALTICVMAFGVVDEFLQSAVDNGRSFEGADILADWAGAWIAFFAAPPAIRKVLKVKV